MKKLLSILLACLMVLSLTACGEEKSGKEEEFTLCEDLSFLPREAKEFFDENRDKALSFSMSGGTFLYGQYKVFDLMKTPQPMEVDGKNYMVTSSKYETAEEYLKTIFNDRRISLIKSDGKFIDAEGYGAFLDFDGPYVGLSNMNGYRVYKNDDTAIEFVQQVYTEEATGKFTGICYKLENTENGWRFYKAEYTRE